LPNALPTQLEWTTAVEHFCFFFYHQQLIWKNIQLKQIQNEHMKLTYIAYLFEWKDWVSFVYLH